MTDSGRRVKFVITVAVGNNDGYVGIGQAKGKEVGTSIRKAIDNAKSNIMEIRRGCGSWECGCGKPHSVPFAIQGKSGSVEITLKPAPHGIGLATGDVAKKILKLAGIEDCWTFTRGKTKTTVNYAKAVFDALEENVKMRVLDHQTKKIGIVSGSIGPSKKPQTFEPEPVKEDIVRAIIAPSARNSGSLEVVSPAVGSPKNRVFSLPWNATAVASPDDAVP